MFSSIFAPRQTCKDPVDRFIDKLVDQKVIIKKGPDGTEREFSKKDKELISKNVRELFNSKEWKERSLQLEKFDAEQKQLAAECKELAAERKELAAEKERLAARKAELNHIQAENHLRLEQAESISVQLDQDEKNVVVRSFLRIFFSVRDLPNNNIDQINSLFSTYVNQSISLEMNETTKKDYSQLNSMTGVIKYIQDHSNDAHVKKCDLLHFKDKIHDVSTFANFLAQASCPVRSVRIINSLSAQERAMLNAAVVSRKAIDANRDLRVIYAEVPKQA